MGFPEFLTRGSLTQVLICSAPTNNSQRETDGWWTHGRALLRPALKKCLCTQLQTHPVLKHYIWHIYLFLCYFCPKNWQHSVHMHSIGSFWAHQQYYPLPGNCPVSHAAYLAQSNLAHQHAYWAGQNLLMQDTCTVWCYCTFSFSVHIERAKTGKKKSEINTRERREEQHMWQTFKKTESLQILLMFFALVTFHLLICSVTWGDAGHYSALKLSVQSPKKNKSVHFDFMILMKREQKHAGITPVCIWKAGWCITPLITS